MTLPRYISNPRIQGLQHFASDGYASVEVIKSSAGALYSFAILNCSDDSGYVQFHDGYAEPSNGAVPFFTFPIAARGDSSEGGLSFDLPEGIQFESGITFALSSTLHEYTPVADTSAAWIVALFYA
jgi:hypothetical protein